MRAEDRVYIIFAANITCLTDFLIPANLLFQGSECRESQRDGLEVSNHGV